MMLRHKLSTYRRLGWRNLLRVAAYRGAIGRGWHPVQKVQRTLGGREFFRPFAGPGDLPVPPGDWTNQATYFGWHEHALQSGSPAWWENPFSGLECRRRSEPWWRIPDFGLETGDVKVIWELSRLDWVLRFAQRAATGSGEDLARLNRWLVDWCRENPAYQGPNWKCGQEASIRVLHLVVGARLLGQELNPTRDLAALVEAHLARIAPTIHYALAQDNNHGTSEAAALFLGGLLCRQAGLAAGARWAAMGRKWLEERARRLIGPDGSFSQYSLNYHRLLLDTFSCAELGCRWFEEPPFTPDFRIRAAAAADWLFHHVEPGSGDGPNLGDNDGANLLPLTATDYRDYRPSVQLGMALFHGTAAYPGDGPQVEHLRWLGVSRPGQKAVLRDRSHFSSGGYAALRHGAWSVFFKYPRYAFRPRHCDALHLDVWHRDVNLSGDAGTFSYNADPPLQDYFQSTAAHNTVSFDQHDQMPRIGRFLRGRWLDALDVQANPGPEGFPLVQAAYEDHRGCRHFRQVQMKADGLRVIDRVEGFRSRAILRWHLCPGNWRLDGDRLVGDQAVLSWAADVPVVRQELTTGWRSRYYLQKEEVPVLEVELGQSGEIVTTLTAGCANGSD